MERTAKRSRYLSPDNMRRFTALISFALVGSCLAQEASIGISGGPSIGRLHGNNIFEQVNPITGHQFGASYTRWFKNGFGVQVQPIYARMGTAVDFIGTDVDGNETFRDEVRYLFDHLGFGIGAAYRTPGRVYALATLGLMPSIVFSSQARSPAFFNEQGDVVVTYLTSKVNNPVLLGYGSIGGAVDLKAPITIGLLVRYDHGLTTLSRADFFENEDMFTTSWTAVLTVAYRWSRAKSRSPVE